MRWEEPGEPGTTWGGTLGEEVAPTTFPGEDEAPWTGEDMLLDMLSTLLRGGYGRSFTRSAGALSLCSAVRISKGLGNPAFPPISKRKVMTFTSISILKSGHPHTGSANLLATFEYSPH